ncbi:ficolin-1-like, partial [Elysia marginata]
MVGMRRCIAPALLTVLVLAKGVAAQTKGLGEAGKAIGQPGENGQARQTYRRQKGCYRGMNETTSEPFLIMMDEALGREIRCDAQTDGGGWIVFQVRAELGKRREKGDVDFYNKLWVDYRNGFGNLSMDFWLGNEALYNLTSKNSYELRVDIISTEGENLYNVYSTFNVSSEKD